MHASGLGARTRQRVELASCCWAALHAALFDTLGTKTDKLMRDCGTWRYWNDFLFAHHPPPADGFLWGYTQISLVQLPDLGASRLVL